MIKAAPGCQLRKEDAIHKRRGGGRVQTLHFPHQTTHESTVKTTAILPFVPGIRIASPRRDPESYAHLGLGCQNVRTFFFSFVNDWHVALKYNIIRRVSSTRYFRCTTCIGLNFSNELGEFSNIFLSSTTCSRTKKKNVYLIKYYTTVILEYLGNTLRSLYFFYKQVSIFKQRLKKS